MSTGLTPAWSKRLPLAQARVGGNVHCQIEPDGENDALFSEWECPLVWKWVASRMKIDNAFQQTPALRFNFARQNGIHAGHHGRPLRPR